MKLLRFWYICLLYIAIVPVMIIVIMTYFLVGCFVFIYGIEIVDVLNKFSEKLSIAIDSKIKEANEYEHNLLNKDVHERCLAGEFGLRIKNISWKFEIFITALLIVALILIICYI